MSQSSDERPAISRDPRLKSVEWRDLVAVRRIEVVAEPLLPAAWLAASLVLAGYRQYVIALGCSFFFLTGLRLVHNALNSALGLPRRTTDIVLRTHHVARMLHHRLKNLITFNMFLHIEHHLFPRVPTCHLPELSRRIDRVAPDLRSKIVF